MKHTRPSVVFLHGAFCGGWSFKDFAKPFARAGYPVSLPTLRHHDCGMNPPRRLAATSLIDYADDLAASIARLDVAPVLVGHLLGGLLAQMLAARGLARAVVLLAPSSPWGVLPSTLFEVGSAQALYFAGDFWNQVLAPQYAIAAANSLDKLSAKKRDAVYAQFVPESGLATFETLHWALDAKRATYVRARDVACPVLCLTGSEDRINPPATVRRMAERYDQAVYEEVPGRSHWLIGEDGWQDVADRILQWLKGTLAAPANQSLSGVHAGPS